ncbi:MAG: DedA family protein [Candidatus Peregrinibacteria bacterium]|nr:DedA family protein [Candidatus Peregrinibacteria bacterium]
MAIESSFVPLPAELIITPAAYLAYQGKMNVYLIVVFGVLGSLVGALFNYLIAHFLGKKLIYSLVDKPWARFFFLNRESLVKAEGYFLKYGEASTFIGRMIPVIRHLISLPAGFVGMNLVSFSIYTILGTAVSLSMLAALGYFFGENQALLESYYKEITIGIIALVILVVLVLILRKVVASRKISVE